MCDNDFTNIFLLFKEGRKKNMKRKLFCLLLTLALVLSTAGISFASVSPEYDLFYMERGDSDETTVAYDEKDVIAVNGSSSVSSEWTNVTSSQLTLKISVSETAALGNYAICLCGATSGEVRDIKVFVVDKTAPSIFDLDKSKSGITVSWDPTDVGRYQLQYKAVGGKWKTAADFTSKTSYKITNLTKGKKYFFRVRAVNYNTEWGEIYGDWSKTKAMKF